MNDVFNRVLKLALRTGDKVIIVDPKQAKPYVMMDIDDYEKLLTQSEKTSTEHNLRTSFMGQTKEYSAPIKTAQTSEPRFASALSGSDPLEPDNVSPASADMEKIKMSASQNINEKIIEPIETEEYFYLEPVEN